MTKVHQKCIHDDDWNQWYIEYNTKNNKFLLWHIPCDNYHNDYVEIKYCPVCGQKLTKEKEK